MNNQTIGFQMSFHINDVSCMIKVSSNTLEEQQEEKQVITVMKNTTDGVNMVRIKMMMEDPEFLLTGEGLMENASEEELKCFATEWKRLIQEGECQLLCSMDRFQEHGFDSEQLSELLNHFCPDFERGYSWF